MSSSREIEVKLFQLGAEEGKCTMLDCTIRGQSVPGELIEVEKERKNMLRTTEGKISNRSFERLVQEVVRIIRASMWSWIGDDR